MADDAALRRHAHACDVARRAGAAGLDVFETRGTLDIEAKAHPQDLVSRILHEVEASIRDTIAATFPDDAILGMGAAVHRGARH